MYRFTYSNMNLSVRFVTKMVYILYFLCCDIERNCVAYIIFKPMFITKKAGIMWVWTDMINK